MKETAPSDRYSTDKLIDIITSPEFQEALQKIGQQAVRQSSLEDYTE